MRRDHSEASVQVIVGVPHWKEADGHGPEQAFGDATTEPHECLLVARLLRSIVCLYVQVGRERSATCVKEFLAHVQGVRQKSDLLIAPPLDVAIR